MRDLCENWKYHRNVDEGYSIFSGREYLGEVKSEGLAWGISQLPELLELLEELIDPDELPDVDTYSYVGKKIAQVRGSLQR